MFKLDRITCEPNIMEGQACIRGMRVPISLILNLVANQMSHDDIRAAYPYLEVVLNQGLRLALCALFVSIFE